MSTRRLLLCGFICAGIIGYYALFEVVIPMQERQEAENSRKVLMLEKKDVLGITVRGDSLVSLQREGVSWRITAPVSFPADEAQVDALLSMLVGMSSDRSVERKGSKEPFGLDKPKAEIALRTPRGVTILSIGKDSPTSSFVYASVSGRRDVLLLPVRVKRFVSIGLNSLKDKHLARIDSREMRLVKIMKHGMILELVRDRHGAWCLSGDQARKLDTGRVNELFKSIGSEKVLSCDPDRTMPAVPDAVVELVSIRGSQRIEAWVEEGRTYAYSDYQKCASEVEGDFMRRLPAYPDRMLDRSLLNLAGCPVGKLVFTGKSRAVLLNRDGAWYAGGNKMRDASSVSALMKMLGSIAYRDAYLVLPAGASKEFGMRICDAAESPSQTFDITVYSKYYLGVDGRFYLISVRDMEDLKTSVNTLLKECE